MDERIARAYDAAMEAVVDRFDAQPGHYYESTMPGVVNVWKLSDVIQTAVDAAVRSVLPENDHDGEDDDE